MLIKIKCRKNLLYLFVYYFSAFINNNCITILLLWYSGFVNLDIGRFSYPIDNIIGGLIVFLSQKYSTRKKEILNKFIFKLFLFLFIFKSILIKNSKFFSKIKFILNLYKYRIIKNYFNKIFN